MKRINPETEISRLEKAKMVLQQHREQAEAANRAKSEFLADISHKSHELRTCLNHIVGFTDLTVSGHFGELNTTHKEFLTAVLVSSRHLLSLVNNISYLSKIDAGEIMLELSDVHLAPLLENSLAMVREEAAKHQVRLTTEIGDLPDTITADERKVKQILNRLLSNALKSTLDDGEIHLSADVIRGLPSIIGPGGEKASSIMAGSGNRFLPFSPTAICVAVADTGVGLASLDLERIFDPFEKAYNSVGRKFPGADLGLSLAQKLVLLHGGKLWAESEGLGRGTTFTFTLPV